MPDAPGTPGVRRRSLRLPPRAGSREPEPLPAAARRSSSAGALVASSSEEALLTRSSHLIPQLPLLQLPRRLLVRWARSATSSCSLLASCPCPYGLRRRPLRRRLRRRLRVLPPPASSSSPSFSANSSTFELLAPQSCVTSRPARPGPRTRVRARGTQPACPGGTGSQSAP
jgi:hypothetical protein